jgi:hypothetical protein
LKSTEEKVLNLDVILAAQVRPRIYRAFIVPDMSEQVVGQPEATKAVADAIQLAYSGLTDPGRPVASFLFVVQQARVRHCSQKRWDIVAAHD